LSRVLLSGNGKRLSNYICGVPESIWSIAYKDFKAGIKNYRVWSFLGWQDIRQRYRRSLLGPFWLTLSTATMVAMMSLLYGQLFRLPLDVYAPFLACGTIIWTMIATILNESCTAFMDGESLIKQVKMPLTVHVFRMVWRNIVIFFHNIVILIPVWLVFDKGLSPLHLLTALLGVSFIALNGLWVGIVLGALCARFRDIGPIISNLIQVVFFLTPIMWLPEVLEGRGVASWLVQINPFYHFLETVRNPLLNTHVPIESWGVVLGITLVGGVFGAAMLGRFKNRVPYWL